MKTVAMNTTGTKIQAAKCTSSQSSLTSNVRRSFDWFVSPPFVRPSVRLTVKMHCAPSLVLTLRSPDQLALPPSLSSRPFEALSFFRVFRSQDPSEWNGFILNHLLPICQSIRTSKNVSSFSFVVQKFVSVSVEKTL